jgi:hypothetical protein
MESLKSTYASETSASRQEIGKGFLICMTAEMIPIERGPEHKSAIGLQIASDFDVVQSYFCDYLRLTGHQQRLC